MPPPLVLNDLTGGISGNHPAALEDNQLTIGANIDYFLAMLGARRNGSTTVKSSITTPQWINKFTPSSDATLDQLWSLDTANAWYKWAQDYTRVLITPSPADVFDNTANVSTASLHGKFYIASKSTNAGALNRLHLWDGTNLRRAGLAPPVLAPVVATTGVGTFTRTRYYRVRFTVQVAGVTTLRSEPSPQTTFAPPGTGLSARITMPALVGEGETHWEVEESIDNANFYRIATTVVATTTYDDSLAYTVVASTGVLSATIGDYNLLWSAKYLTVDRDRMVIAGSHEDATLGSTIGWTPVGNDPIGVGNDERIPYSSGNTLTLDDRDGGDITALASFDARIFAFKLHRAYTLTQTGIRSAAYLPQPYSTTYGALPYSVVEGVDAEGRPALYAFDSNVGPWCIGAEGGKVLAPDLQVVLAASLNLAAPNTCVRGVYHPQKRQVWWHLRSTNAGTYPDFRWVYDTVTGGITRHTMPQVTTAAVLWQNKPHITGSGILVKCDVDGALDDYGNAFRAFFRTKSYELGSALDFSEIKSMVVEGDSQAGVSVTASVIRDYGLETRSVTFNLDPVGAELYVIRPLDNAFMQRCTVVQFEFGDATAVSQAAWHLQRVSIRWAGAGHNVQ